MGAPQYEQAGADIGGTGTTNTIPRWTGPSTLGDSGFVDDGSTIAAASRMFAIGTSSTTGARAVIQNNSSGNTLVIVSSSVAGSAFGQLIEAGTNASDYALNIRQRGTGNPLVYVRGDGNVGIGTASPLSIAGVGLTVYGATNGAFYLQNSSNNSRVVSNGNDVYIDAGAGGTGGAIVFRRSSSVTESARIDSAGNLILNSATTNAVIQASGTGQGLKLPATPGNADTQTLDAYQEGTVTATITTTTGTVTLVASQNTLRYTRIGRMVHVQGYLEVQSVTGPPTGDFVINGLPATIGTQSQSSATGAVWTNNMAAGYTGTAVAITVVGTTTLSVRRITIAGANATDFGTYTQAGTSISISVWYSV